MKRRILTQMLLGIVAFDLSQEFSTYMHTVCVCLMCMCVANKGQSLRLVREFLETQLPPECTLVAVIMFCLDFVVALTALLLENIVHGLQIQ